MRNSDFIQKVFILRRWWTRVPSESVSHSVMPDSLRSHGLQPIRLLCPWGFPGKKNTGVGCHFLLQGIFLTQGSNLGLLHCKRQILHQLSYQEALNKRFYCLFLSLLFSALSSGDSKHLISEFQF